MSMSIIYMKNIYNALAAAMVIWMIWTTNTNRNQDQRQRIITKIRIDYMQKGMCLTIAGLALLFYGRFVVSILGLDFFDSRKAKMLGVIIFTTITLLLAKRTIQCLITGTSAIRKSLILWYAQRHSAKRHGYDIKKSYKMVARKR